MNAPIERNNFVIISGCSGGGKSTLIEALRERGYAVVEEPGRRIVQEQEEADADALPWVDLGQFLDLALARYIHDFNSGGDQLTFFDRGIIDAVQLDASQPSYFHEAARNFRYHPVVFLVPPWEEIYQNDSERKHDFSAAVKEFDELMIKYPRYGYQTTIIPKAPVEDRVNFILHHIRL